MAKANLPVNFKDDILKENMNGKRRFNMIQNNDGTVSFEDVTTYTQVGSTFGAAQINATNEAVNNAADASKIIDSLEMIKANTKSGYIAGALAVKELNSNLGELSGAAIYLGYFDTDYSGSNTYTTTATIPVGYKIVLENVRIRINGLDAVQRCTFITSRTGDHTFTITNTNCTHDQWRFAATTFSAYAIKV